MKIVPHLKYHWPLGAALFSKNPILAASLWRRKT
jgi:hypothetical protein